MKISSILKKITPKKLITIVRKTKNDILLLSSYFYDFNRYINYSGTTKQDNNKKLIGKIIAHYHVIEKGLSFEEMRPLFGLTVIQNLVALLSEYMISGYDKNDFHFITACSVLVKYRNSHLTNEENLKIIDAFINEEIKKYANFDLGGSKTVRKSDILDCINIDYESFFNSRHSIREFSNENVDSIHIMKAFEIAKKYPSVCNRQAVRLYLVEDKEIIANYLSFQNGTRGFGEKIDKLIIVTSDLSVFENANERNQAYIDGGIYLMGLLLALHSVGLGSVALNWSKYKSEDKKFRKSSRIKDCEVIISFVGVGSLKENMTVPKSERSKIEDILTVIR